MKMKQKFLASAIALSALGSAAFAPLAQAEAEVSASVGAANMYYWRGINLGNGDPAVWGDINVSASGFYAGMWASSGDAANGTEYDLYAGFGSEASGFSYDLSLWTYAYPESEISPGELMEVIGSLGYGPVSFSYYHGLEDLEDYWYSTLGLALGDFSLTYGLHEDDLAHFDIGYAYNDNLSFTLGLVLDDAESTSIVDDVVIVESYNDEPKFVVSFSIPIE